MGLSAEAASAHIARWTQALNQPAYAHRVHWPSLLFHHAPVQNAARIINSGEIRSRRHTEGQRPLDVAGAGVIDHRQRAHDFSRLYFRPRTPTQFHIEGVRRPNECHYGAAAHAPMLVMFALDALSILTMPTTRFSDINMQRDEAQDGDTDKFFEMIDFSKVYHEGSFGGDASIANHRAAEVLCQSPLSLIQHLKWIVCRSEAERETLIHMAGADGRALRQRIVTSDDGKVFEKKYAFVEKVYISPKGVSFSLNPRQDRATLKVRVEVHGADGNLVFDETYNQIGARPENGGSWISEVNLSDGVHRVQVYVDDHLAYQNFLNVGDAFF